MKGLAPSLGIALSVLLAGEMAARDLKTTTGEVFHNFAVTKKEPTGLRIVHDDGAAFVDFILLSEAEKKEFGFDAAAYAAGSADKAAAEKALATQQAAAAVARKAAERANAERNYAERDYTARDYSQRQVPPIAPVRQGLQVTVDTPGFSYQTYRGDGLIYFDGTQPGVVGRIRGYYRADGSYYGPIIIRQR